MVNETKTDGKDRQACSDVATETLTEGEKEVLVSACFKRAKQLKKEGAEKRVVENWEALARKVNRVLEVLDEENFCETCGEEMPKGVERFCSQDCHNKAVKKVESALDSDADYQEVIDEEMAKDKVNEVAE